MWWCWLSVSGERRTVNGERGTGNGEWGVASAGVGEVDMLGGTDA